MSDLRIDARVLDEIPRSVHLSASAGSGKTRELTMRYRALLNALEDAAGGLDQSVAITFTDKAAAEIKERVMRSLAEPTLKKIVRGRQDLRISTIHSFCMHLLKRYPLEAGLPPDFGVLDDRDKARIAGKAIDDALDALRGDEPFMEPLQDFPMARLTADLGFLLSSRSRLRRLEVDAGGSDALVTRLTAEMRGADAAAELAGLLGSPAWNGPLREMHAILKERTEHYEANQGDEHLALAGSPDAGTALLLADALERLYFTQEGEPRKSPSITKKAFGTDGREAYERAFAKVQELLIRLRTLADRSRAEAEAAGLLELFFRVDDLYWRAKLREGLLDFDDLEVAAYQLLRSAASPEVLYWLDRKVVHFLVDEFQDTSDIQWAVLDALTEELFSGQGSDKPMPPTLFVVGDKKQSIYRFREANYRLIDQVRDRMTRLLPADKRSVRTLDTNYRSTPEVVDAVNALFGRLWGADYQPSESARAGQRGSVKLVGLHRGSAEGGAAQAAEDEARALAAEVAAVLTGGTTVWEKQNDGTYAARPARCSDCAVLIQSRTHLKTYERALQDANIPYRVVGGIGFYEEDEIQAVLSVLFFLGNRSDHMSLAAALRSPLFALPLQGLLDVFSAGPDPLEALRQRRPDIAELFDRWRLDSGTAPVAHTVHRIIADTGAYIRFGRRSRQALFNLDKLLDMAREFDRKGYSTLLDFTDRVLTARATEQREATADMDLPGAEGAVSVLTVHKAKGLEYHVVFLPGLNKLPQSLRMTPRAVIETSRDEAGERFRLAVKGSAVYDELWKTEREELLREHQRLLYVAMTRARDHLVMLGTYSATKTAVTADTWHHMLTELVGPPELAKDAPAGRYISSHPGWEHSYAPPAAIDRLPDPVAAEGEIDPAVALANLARLAPEKLPQWRTPTDLVNEAKEQEITTAVPQPPSGAVSPRIRGIVLHRCLELLATADAVDPSAACLELTDVRALDDAARSAFIDGIGRTVDSLQQDPALAWVFERGDNAYTELPFLFRRGGDIISGTMDRVIVKDGTAVVIDYKSNLIRSDADRQAFIELYLPQVKVYCEAAREMFVVQKAVGYLLFLDGMKLERVVEMG